MKIFTILCLIGLLIPSILSDEGVSLSLTRAKRDASFLEKSTKVSFLNEYAVTCDTPPLWVAQIPSGSPVTEVIAFALQLYSPTTWISAVDKNNMRSIVCNNDINCRVINDTNQTIQYLDYNITGKTAEMVSNNYTFIYVNNVTTNFSAQINGGLGLGALPGVIHSFPYSFQNLKPIFSLFFSRNAIQSSDLLIGGYNNKYIVWNAQYNNISSINKARWEFSLTQMGTQSLDAVAILDPNFEYFGIPESHYQVFLNNFTTINHLTCANTTIYPNCSCRNFDKLGYLTITLDETDLQIPPNAYSTESRGTCYLLFAATTINENTTNMSRVNPEFEHTYILGLPFLSYYYNVFYYEDGILSIAPATLLSTTTWAWVLMISLSSLFFTGAVIYRCIKVKKHRKRKSKKHHDKDRFTPLIETGVSK